jgi:sugar-specific transcriptional regulator TrmB
VDRNLTYPPDSIETLHKLGLTLNEARVLLTLSELGTATAKTIAKTSGVAREVIYQTLPLLLKKGLVEERITSPKSFKAIPMKEVFAILIQRKEEESRHLFGKVEEILKKQQEKINPQAEEHQIILIPAGKSPYSRIEEAAENVQKTVDLTFPFRKFYRWTQKYAEEIIRKLGKRNVKIRIITEKQLLKTLINSPEIHSHSEISKLKHVNFKYLQNVPRVEMIIFDKKTLFISTTKEKDIHKMQWLYSNNPPIVEMANSYFETLWKKAANGNTI